MSWIFFCLFVFFVYINDGTGNALSFLVQRLTDLSRNIQSLVPTLLMTDGSQPYVYLLVGTCPNYCACLSAPPKQSCRVSISLMPLCVSACLFPAGRQQRGPHSGGRLSGVRLSPPPQRHHQPQGHRFHWCVMPTDASTQKHLNSHLCNLQKHTNTICSRTITHSSKAIFPKYFLDREFFFFHYFA